MANCYFMLSGNMNIGCKIKYIAVDKLKMDQIISERTLMQSEVIKIYTL